MRIPYTRNRDRINRNKTMRATRLTTTTTTTSSSYCCQKTVGRDQAHPRSRMIRPPSSSKSEYTLQRLEGTGRWAATGLLIAVLASTSTPAMAMDDADHGDTTSNPYIQELLKISESKREERRKERLQDYYRRNFTDYFNFETSPGMSQQGLSPETSNQMKQWLKDNTPRAP